MIVSIREGKQIPRESQDNSVLVIEDPFDTSLNICCGIRPKEFLEIKEKLLEAYVNCLQNPKQLILKK